MTRDDGDEGDQPQLDRVQKVLAAAGVGSRRSCERLIEQGRVTVDGQVVTLGDKCDPVSADVRVDGERVNVDPEKIYVMLNKPRGVVTTADDPQDRQTVMDLINLTQRLFPVGRLDMDTEGLLLLTNDGELAHKLMHPSYEVPRVYVVLVPAPMRKGLAADLRAGVELEDGLAVPRSVQVLDESKTQALIELTLTEGRNREVRRMVQAVGTRVERLARVSYAGVELGELRQGKWRFLTHPEVAQLHAAVEQQTDKSAKRRSNKSTKRRDGASSGRGRDGQGRGQGRAGAGGETSRGSGDGASRGSGDGASRGSGDGASPGGPRRGSGTGARGSRGGAAGKRGEGRGRDGGRSGRGGSGRS